MSRLIEPDASFRAEVEELAKDGVSHASRVLNIGWKAVARIIDGRRVNVATYALAVASLKSWKSGGVS